MDSLPVSRYSSSVMIRIVHLLCASLLLLSHGIFLGRSIFLLRTSGKPVLLDRLALNLSQLLLPVTILTGFLMGGEKTFLSSVHILLGLSPLLFMILFRKKSFRRKHPLFLPGVNGLLLAAAWLSGIL